jgi:short-subunit dehydrogenase
LNPLNGCEGLQMRDLKGESVVITGASSGIGQGAPIAFARREEALHKATACCEAEGCATRGGWRLPTTRSLAVAGLAIAAGAAALLLAPRAAR